MSHHSTISSIHLTWMINNVFICSLNVIIWYMMECRQTSADTIVVSSLKCVISRVCHVLPTLNYAEWRNIMSEISRSIKYLPLSLEAVMRVYKRREEGAALIQYRALFDSRVRDNGATYPQNHLQWGEFRIIQKRRRKQLTSRRDKICKRDWLWGSRKGNWWYSTPGMGRILQ